ncbi:MAG: hypothetical protein GXY23_10180 [Myxococcales bacterium]|jgi:hypothetical protein|nr:hypothetical protein [Myxococcales bacterium]
MLPPFIIEQIRQRERESRRSERPRLELPLFPPDVVTPPSPPEKETEERGVVIIDLLEKD